VVDFLKKKRFEASVIFTKLKLKLIVNKKMILNRVSDYCLTPTQQFLSYMMARTSYINVMM